MIIYYSLLLSFSEQIGFTMAYLVASVATIVLIMTFIGSLLKNRNAALLFGFILSVFYIFIYGDYTVRRFRPDHWQQCTIYYCGYADVFLEED